ncbi:MAG: hypothetical protein ACLR89_10410 [Bacteroides uniformis]
MLDPVNDCQPAQRAATCRRSDTGSKISLVYLQHDSDVGLKIHSFRQMFGHQSKRMKTGVHIQPVFQAHIHADG